MILLSTALAAPLLEEPLQALVKPALDAQQLDTVVVGVVRRGETAVHAFSREGRPDERLRFELGSVSKALDGLLLADAIGRKEVTADTPAADILGWKLPTRDGRAITLAQLATHTSGWPRMPAEMGEVDPADPYAKVDLAALQRAAEGTPLVERPGATYAYSNLGAAVLGAALAKAAGKPWEVLLDERIARPLRARSLTVDSGPLAQGHDIDLRPVGPWTLGAFAPAGGVEGSVHDVLDLLVAMQTPGGPMRATFDRALESRVDLGPSGGVGYGWHVSPEGTRWHNGETGGFHSLVAVHPTRQIGVVVLANTATPLVDTIGFATLELLAGQNVPPLDLPRVATVSPEVLASRVGTWGPATITLHGDHLRLTGPGVDARLWPVSPTTYLLRRPDGDAVFSGDVLEIHLPDGVQRLTRSR
ncbi:MAG: beta-lactamase family protein [Alphaproteobacteria bacterium]|nr:beta-lactamase family protein [Alphaproteobacteria bacterium]MCB9693374.1 beta-lactamase family protein [Alphaproteobacteria bacterium]